VNKYAGVAELRRLDHNCPLQFENVLVAEKINAQRATGELLIGEGIRVRPPVDLRDVIARDPHCREHPLDFRLMGI